MAYYDCTSENYILLIPSFKDVDIAVSFDIFQLDPESLKDIPKWSYAGNAYRSQVEAYFDSSVYRNLFDKEKAILYLLGIDDWILDD